MLFTILAGAKRHRLEPWAYLRDVVLRLSTGAADLESLLPAAGPRVTRSVCGTTVSTSRGVGVAAGAARQEHRAIPDQSRSAPPLRPGWRPRGKKHCTIAGPTV